MSLALATRSVRNAVSLVVATSAASDESLASSTSVTSHHGVQRVQRARWQSVIDRGLVEWATDFGRRRLEADGLRPPTTASLQLAVEIVYRLRDNNNPPPCPPPLRIVPNGEGGLVMEWVFGDNSMSVEIGEEGTAETLTFESGRLVARDSLL